MTIQRAVRPPAVAGRFYPDDPGELEGAVRRLLGAARPSRRIAGRPAAVVAPHAAYLYSGPVAASAWALVSGASSEIAKVVLLGPSHYVAFEGLALPECDVLSTPLGEYRLEEDGVATLEASPLVRRWDLPHRDEHSIEVQLPFLGIVLGDVPILPLVTGIAKPADLADVLETVCSDDTLLVVSSDLSHYLPFDEAREVDTRTADAITGLRSAELGPSRACGVVGLRGLLEVARRRSLESRCVDLRSSGDTYGPRNRVVGYGAFGFWRREA